MVLKKNLCVYLFNTWFEIQPQWAHKLFFFLPASSPSTGHQAVAHLSPPSGHCVTPHGRCLFLTLFWSDPLFFCSSHLLPFDAPHPFCPLQSLLRWATHTTKFMFRFSFTVSGIAACRVSGIPLIHHWLIHLCRCVSLISGRHLSSLPQQKLLLFSVHSSVDTDCGCLALFHSVDFVLCHLACTTFPSPLKALTQLSACSHCVLH